ncbi:hypothetical protein DICPUDRAFT_154254 [Dictyostelium purpureum]|uniref:Uncharacterized protein n=1 Tax=Dictyostelium purpureum TaxID=5786 RepID=F0ZQV3_DICPU|nr:uncharacterized protein DICPUDRAFT_154254 [Dictyostelium purpureum]EGC33674.1 hypothetical protein DICPUDRAFT_154254 [Dictyostelium purpureum]|eukprot:XP_003289793.1 hypothetical protein DICPUDRAFT_154254 [Dictyostelium purpureum]
MYRFCKKVQCWKINLSPTPLYIQSSRLYTTITTPTIKKTNNYNNIKTKDLNNKTGIFKKPKKDLYNKSLPTSSDEIQIEELHKKFKKDFSTIETLLNNNQIEEAIKKYNKYDIENGINIKAFSAILLYQLNNSNIDNSNNNIQDSTTNIKETIIFFRNNVDQYKQQFSKIYLKSDEFLEFLRAIYSKSSSSVMEIYNILLESDLIDIRMNFIFCNFYLDLGLEKNAEILLKYSFQIEEISDNNKNNKNNKNNNKTNKYIKILKFLKTPVLKITKKEEYELKILFIKSCKFPVLYQMLVDLFIPSGITEDSRYLVPSFICVINACLESNQIELLEQMMEPYKKNKDPLDSNKSIVIGMAYFYAHHRNLINLKNYLYQNFLGPNNDNNVFKNDLLDTVILYALEQNDYHGYGNALYFSDVKKSEIKDDSMDFYLPFKEYHRFVHHQARDFWVEKESGNNSKNLIYKNRYSTERLIKATDKLLNIEEFNSTSNTDNSMDILENKIKLLSYHSQLKSINVSQNGKKFIEEFRQYLVTLDKELSINQIKTAKKEYFDLESTKYSELREDKLLKEKHLFYTVVPHSPPFISAIKRFRNSFKELEDGNNKFIDFILKLKSMPLRDLLTTNSDWATYIENSKSDLFSMTQKLPKSIYKSNEFYNYWLQVLSSDCKNNTEMIWNLFGFMLDNNITIETKSLSKFSSAIFNSNIELSETQLNNLKRIETNGNTNLNILRMKLKYYPTNNFSEYDEFQYSKDALIDSLEVLKGKEYESKSEMLKLYTNIASRVYPLNQSISNIHSWKPFPNNFFFQEACQIMIQKKMINHLKLFIGIYSREIGLLNHSSIMNIISPLPPIKQKSFIEHYLKKSSNYPIQFINYIKNLKKSLQLTNDQNSKVLDEIISTENSNIHNNIDKIGNNNIDNNTKDFNDLFIKVYLNK